MKRKHKEKFNCVYCGKSTATFCGYWKMVSVANYKSNNKRDKKTLWIDSCYAHIGCYLKRHQKLLLTGPIPLCVDNPIYDRPKQIVEMMRLHNIKIQKVKNTIKFLERVIKEHKSSQTPPSKKKAKTN